MADLSDLAGAWRLLEFTVVTPDGQTVHPLGDRPAGRLFYGQTGWMSAHLMHGDSQDVGRDSQAPRVSALSYCGSVRIEEDLVIHDVQISSRAGDVGTTLVRRMQRDGDRLILIAEAVRTPVAGTGRLVWVPLTSMDQAL